MLPLSVSAVYSEQTYVANASENKFLFTEGYKVAQAVCKIDGTSGSEGLFIFLRQCSTPEQEIRSKCFENVKYSAKLQNHFCNFCRLNEDAKSSQIPSHIEHSWQGCLLST